LLKPIDLLLSGRRNSNCSRSADREANRFFLGAEKINLGTGESRNRGAVPPENSIQDVLMVHSAQNKNRRDGTDRL
jgi:hypothetical protein